MQLVQEQELGGLRAAQNQGLAELVRDRVDPSLEIKFITYDDAYKARDFEDMRRRVPDLSKARNAIGYNPATSIEEIIDMVVAYFQTHEEERVAL